MIKVQLVLCVAYPTLSAVSFPNFKLDGRWNNSAPLCVHVNRPSKVLVTFHRYELKFVNKAMLIAFLPSVHEMEDSVV